MRVFFYEANISSSKNLSCTFRLAQRKKYALEHEHAPAYRSRIEDGVPLPPPDIFDTSYDIVRNNLIPLKTREIGFQILNRNLCTNNEAFKSNMRPDLDCRFYGAPETIEHLICDCNKYSYGQWELLAQILTKFVQKTDRNAPSFVKFSEYSIQSREQVVSM